MKNVQVIDGADNATFSIFRATEDEFANLFPNPGQDIEFVEDFFARHYEPNAAAILRELWLRPVHKSKALGIDGTLFYDHAGKRHHLPANKREIDRAPSQINPAQRELYARLRAAAAMPAADPTPATTADLLGAIQGGAQLLQWFGRVPSFHDAEVLTLALDREKTRCDVRIHTFEMTAEVDVKGFFVSRNHVVVSFRLEGVIHLELIDFNQQNVIYGLSLSCTANGDFRLEMEPCHGLSGFIEARSMTIELAPGKPDGGAI